MKPNLVVVFFPKFYIYPKECCCNARTLLAKGFIRLVLVYLLFTRLEIVWDLGVLLPEPCILLSASIFLFIYKIKTVVICPQRPLEESDSI